MNFLSIEPTTSTSKFIDRMMRAKVRVLTAGFNYSHPCKVRKDGAPSFSCSAKEAKSRYPARTCPPSLSMLMLCVFPY